MRTTLDIDDDILAAAKDLAKAEGKTAGQVISELARRALTTPSNVVQPGFAEAATGFEHTGWHSLPSRDGLIITPEMIAEIEEELVWEDAKMEPPRRKDSGKQ